MNFTESEDRNDALKSSQKNVDLEKAIDELKSQLASGGADEDDEMFEESDGAAVECERVKEDSTKANDPKQLPITNFFAFGQVKEATVWKNVAESIKRINNEDGDGDKT